MRVILFFTYGISLLEWKKSGLLDREIKLYKKLNEDYGLNFTFVTYGDKSDFAILNELKIDPEKRAIKVINKPT